MPVNVVAFDDGADVYSSVQVEPLSMFSYFACLLQCFCIFLQIQYSNLARTEEIKNIHPKYRRRFETCAFLGTSAGGVTHKNTLDRTCFYEQQRRSVLYSYFSVLYSYFCAVYPKGNAGKGCCLDLLKSALQWKMVHLPQHCVQTK